MSGPFAYQVEIQAGSLGWVDITADVRGGVSIKRGRSGEGYRADPGGCSFRLDNRTGRYSPRNPLSDLYGYIGRNTPVRVHAGPAGGTLVARFHGEIPAWPPRWSLSGADRYVDIDAAGILGRFRQGDAPERSPMRRTMAAAGPLAYWPAEDGSTASQVASVVDGVAPAAVSGTVTFTTVEDLVLTSRTLRFGARELLDLAAGGSITAAVPPGPASPWTVAVAMALDPTTYAADVIALSWTTPGGTYDRWEIVATKAWAGAEGAWTEQLVAYPASGGSAVRPWITTGITQGLMLWRCSAEQVGGNIVTRFNGATGTASLPGTLAPITSVTVNATRTTSTAPMPAGHLVVWPTADLPYYVGNGYRNASRAAGSPNQRDMVEAFRSEGATARLRRIAAEAGYTVTGPATPDGSELHMGWQPIEDTSTLLDQSTAVDGGMLTEARDALALAYLPRATLYNQTPVTIAYVGQTAPPFDPVDDVDDVRNDVTVSRTDGSSARAVELTGPLAAVEPPAGVGIYTTSETLNVELDVNLPDQAGWRLHLGTVDEPRYPAISVQLAEPSWQAAPALQSQLLALDVGGVLEVSGVPVWAAGRVRTLVTGYTEQVSEQTWRITFNGVPASPWDVAVVDGPPRVAADGTVLAATVTADAMALQITSPATTGPWTESAEDMPLDLRVGGEQVTVSAIWPAVADVFGRTLAGGWGDATTGHAWTTSGGSSSDYSAVGG